MTSRGQIPAWLEAPPTAFAGPPPVEIRQQGLPFSQLPWTDFERLILRLVRKRQDVLECSIYGTPGQAQQGLDIISAPVPPEQRLDCYQVKRVAIFEPKDVKSAVDLFIDGKWTAKARSFVLCVSSSLQSTQHQDVIATQRARLAEIDIVFSTWDGAASGALCEQLKGQPELVDDFFSRSWVRVFNGEEAALALGERLDGADSLTLRQRLTALYSIIFAQHDPGLRGHRPQTTRYEDRYVPADITERTGLETSAGRPYGEPNQDFGGVALDSSDGVAGADARLTDNMFGTYEARRPVLEWLRTQQAGVVLGEPGFGKSVLLRFVALSTLQPDGNAAESLGGAFLERLPVWLSFARFSAAIARKPESSIEDFFREWLHQNSFSDVFPLLQRALRHSQVLLLVDGLDEAVSAADGKEALDRIVAFRTSRAANVICSSRPRGFPSLGVPAIWSTVSLAPLTDLQIQELSRRWFRLSEAPADAVGMTTDTLGSENRRAENFLREVRANSRTHELARNPLLCQALIELFRTSHRLPEARVSAYAQIVQLLLTNHPTARAHAAHTSTSLDRLGLRQSELTDYVIQIAEYMQVDHRTVYINRPECEKVCARFLADETNGLGLSPPEARRQAAALVESLINHFGILVERSPGDLSFVHLSIQEYLTAEAMARKPDTVQLNWLEQSWQRFEARESIISWFGLLGSRGKKPLAGAAAQRLRELGAEGEWQRMLSLSLRTEVACSESAIPISEARKVVAEATSDVEESPFSDHRVTLARSITIGALGGPLRDVCLSAIGRWGPGRPSFNRARLLSALKSWQPADDVLDTLTRGLRDEDFNCRRAAADSLANLFCHSPETGSALSVTAHRDVRPEVRSAAICALGLASEWSQLAQEAADANLHSVNAELLMAATTVRVRQQRHTEDDLGRVLALREADMLTGIGNDLVDALCNGWPTNTDLRNAFLDELRHADSTAGTSLPLEYLVRCCPGDQEVAEVIVRLLERFESHFVSDSGRIFALMQAGFRGHPTLVPALKKMLKDQEKKYKAIFWDPQTTPAFIVIGDEWARDQLINAYATAERMGKYWIAKTLQDGWPQDSAALSALRSWATGSSLLAGPMSKWLQNYIPDPVLRRAKLQQLVGDPSTDTAALAMTQLLEQFPDEQGKTLVEGRLFGAQLWYYHRVQIEGLLARNFPNDPKSLDIVERSFQQIDETDPADFASGFESVQAIRTKLLAVATPAYADVRLAVAGLLAERSTDPETALGIIHNIFSEESGPVRTTGLIALGRALKPDAERSRRFSATLIEDIESRGTFHRLRQRSALAALLEIGSADQAAQKLALEGTPNWSSSFVNRLDVDPVSISVILSHWSTLQPMLAQYQANYTTLPFNELLYGGYGPFLEQFDFVADQLDEYLSGDHPKWLEPAYLEQLARRFPGTQRMLYALFPPKRSGYISGLSCTGARLLYEQFAGQAGALEKINSMVEESSWRLDRLAPGVVGYLAAGWPASEVANYARSKLAADPHGLPMRDRLIISMATNAVGAAEKVVREMLSNRLEPWTYKTEDVHALKYWARSESSSPVLIGWVSDDDPSLSMTAMSLLGERPDPQTADAGQVLRRFNDEMRPERGPVADGLDAPTRAHTAWVVGANAFLKRQTSH